MHPLGKLGQPHGRFSTSLELEVRVNFGHSEIGDVLEEGKVEQKQSGKLESITGWLGRNMTVRKLNSKIYPEAKSTLKCKPSSFLFIMLTNISSNQFLEY